MNKDEIRECLLSGLTDEQANAVRSGKRQVLVVAGAGSGKTEVMARRIAWWVGMEDIPKDRIVAFTFTEKAAEEMKFRVRNWIGKITPSEESVYLGGMYVGTIHGFCLSKLREYWPDTYHNYDILDETARAALVLRGFNGILALNKLRASLGEGTSQSATVDQFLLAYDQLQEHNKFNVQLPDGDPPYELGAVEREWCKNAKLLTNVGEDEQSLSFAEAASRYYAYLRCRRFLDFSTSQSEFLRSLENDPTRKSFLRNQNIHLVVDEVQDINPVQRDVMEAVVSESGKLTAVGDHRQSIYGFRGAKVEIIGQKWSELKDDSNSEIVDLRKNFRSTPRIIEIANRWSETINPAGGMDTPEMMHGKTERKDQHPSHVALVNFSEREDEANWIAQAIRAVVPTEESGAEHDRRDGSIRGLSLADVAVLVRSSTDVRTYMQALERAGIPSVVRAGPDLFSQPEVLFFLGTLALSAGMEEFIGSHYNPKSMPKRIENVLGCDPRPEPVIRESARQLRNAGFKLEEKTINRIIDAGKLIRERIENNRISQKKKLSLFRNKNFRSFLQGTGQLRRVFPQQLYHWLLTEAEVEHWDTCRGRNEAAMFHLGTLSSLIMGLETPGWTSVSDYKWQIIGLCQYGAEEGRVPEQPLIVQPDAVTISTIHAVKGLEFAAVFLADVCARRFPSQMSRHKAKVPISGDILQEVDIDGLSDNENHDGERRLMYVALTRAERFLIISYSSKKQTSKFIKELRPIVTETGGIVTSDSDSLLNEIRHAPLEYKRDVLLSTSFSDLRYYLSCPHDFYLRKVLGFSPTIVQAFGYGRGVHNLMRAVHNEPDKWAQLAENREKLEASIKDLIDKGLFYLRYTTGDPADRMRNKGVRVVADYIIKYIDELKELTFEPEKEFETLVEYENGEGGAMISGAVDIVRRDDPPKVTLIDFKSGDPDSDNAQKLDEDEMKLQIGVYAIAAKKELQYEPDKGLVRYLDSNTEKGEPVELEVPLDRDSVDKAKRLVVHTATSVRDRDFVSNPQKLNRDGEIRCKTCDFLGMCGMEAAVEYKRNSNEFNDV